MIHGCIIVSALGQTLISCENKEETNWSEALLVVSMILAANAAKWTRWVLLHVLVYCWPGWCFDLLFSGRPIGGVLKKNSCNTAMSAQKKRPD